MSEARRDRPGAGGGEAVRPYEPPRVEKLGSLRDLLAAKSGPGLDPSPVHPLAKK